MHYLIPYIYNFNLQLDQTPQGRDCYLIEVATQRMQNKYWRLYLKI